MYVEGFARRATQYKGCGEKCNFSGGGQKCLDARRPQTREEAYLNGTLTKRVCGQRRRWAFFTTPIKGFI